MAGPLPSADLVSLAIALGFLWFLNIVGWKVKNGTLHIGALVIAVYCDADVISNQQVTWVVAQLQTNSTFFTPFTINGGLWAVLFSVSVLMTFMMLYERLFPSRGNA